jgi:predicted dehydrogenase
MFKSLIIGCGEIAGGFDQDSGNGEAVLTHAGAYRAHDAFSTAICVDPDEAHRKAFMDHWEIPLGFSGLDQCLDLVKQEKMAFDVASVCVPTKDHESALESLLDAPVRAVFAEKPLSGDIEISRRLVGAYEAAGKPLMVNYFRRFDPAMDGLRKSLANGDWGDVLSVSASYSKGILNCGSHMIDLIGFLLGPLSAKVVFRKKNDYAADDPTIDAFLSTHSGVPIYLIGGDAAAFFTFELEITTQNGCISIEDLGKTIRFRRLEAHPLFPSRQCLGQGEWEQTGFDRAMVSALDNLVDFWGGKAALLSDGRNALEAESVAMRLQEMAAPMKFFGDGSTK